MEKRDEVTKCEGCLKPFEDGRYVAVWKVGSAEYFGCWYEDEDKACKGMADLLGREHPRELLRKIRGKFEVKTPQQPAQETLDVR